MSNYYVIKSGIVSREKYQDLSDKVYGKKAYTRDDLVKYSNKLSFGFAGRCKLYFYHALASIGLISGARRDEVVAAQVNGIARTLIQQIGKDTGYYTQDRAQPVSLFDKDEVPVSPSELGVDIREKGFTSDFSLKAHHVRIDSDDLLERTQALGIELAARVRLPRKQEVVAREAAEPQAAPLPRPEGRMPPAFSLPNALFEGFPRGQ